MRAITCGARARNSLGEPALHVRINQFGQTFLLHEFDAVVPRSLVRVIEVGVGEDKSLDTVGCIGAEPLPDHAAHRQPAPAGLLDLERVENGQHVLAEPFHRIRPRRRAGPAVAAAVIAHQAEMLRPFARLVIPHMQIGAERIRQHQHGRALAARDLDIDRAAIGADHRHGKPFLSLDYGCFGVALSDTLKGLRARCKALFSEPARA